MFQLPPKHGFFYSLKGSSHCSLFSFVNHINLMIVKSDQTLGNAKIAMIYFNCNLKEDDERGDAVDNNIYPNNRTFKFKEETFMTTIKKFISLLLTVLTVISVTMVATVVSTASTASSNETTHAEYYTVATGETNNSDFSYRVAKDGTLTILSYTGSSSTVNIPSTIDGKKVTAIHDHTFSNSKTAVKTITIPETVTDLGISPLMGHTVQTINVAANNPVYTSVSGILYTKDKKTIVRYPSGRTDTSFSIPANVTAIGTGAFLSSNLTAVSMPDTLTSIGDSAFNSCKDLSSLTLSSSLTEIDSYAFEYCEKLNRITIPNGVTKIGRNAFSNCSALTSITIPDSVSDIGQYAFSGTAWMRKQPIGLVYIGKVLLLYNGTIPKNTAIQIKDGTKGIASYAFSLSSPENLISITLPYSLTTLSNGALSDCTSLKNVNLSANVSSIGNSAFSGCSNLATVTVNNKHTAFAPYVFNKCNNMKLVGYKGSTAEAYANEYQIPFEYIKGQSETPHLKLNNVEDGIKISWNKVDGAAQYRVYYKGRNGWTKLTDTTSTSVIDYDVVSGANYTYTIRALDQNGNHISDYDHNGSKIRFIKAPQFSLSNTANGVRISWDKVTGAEKYRVFYYGSKGWTRLADTANTSFLDTDVSSNHRYVYTVRCISADGNTYTSDYRVGKGINYFAAPSLTLKNVEDGVKISWNKIDGAAKYRVYYKGRNGWTKLTDTTSTSVIDKDVASGTNYTYTIRALDLNGNHISDYYRDGFKIKFLRAPSFTLSSEKGGVRIKWNKVGGAEKYRVFYYGSRGWTRLADTANTSFLDTDVSSGHPYVYTVRCISSDGNTYTSDYHVGKGINYR